MAREFDLVPSWNSYITQTDVLQVGVVCRGGGAVCRVLCVWAAFWELAFWGLAFGGLRLGACIWGLHVLRIGSSGWVLSASTEHSTSSKPQPRAPNPL